jgi:XapX domain-containing protein
MAAAIIGLSLGLVIGAGCRFFYIPSPAPPRLIGACLLLAMTVGFVAADHMSCRLGKPSWRWISHETDDRSDVGLRIGFRLPRIWNPVAGAAADPWRASGDDDDDWLHRSRSLDGLASSARL